MRVLAAALLVSWLPAAAAQEVEPGADPVGTEELASTEELDPAGGVDRRVQLDFRHACTLDELEASLAALAAAYPEYLRLESMGRSRGGHELWVLSVTRLSDGDPELKPGLLLVGGLGDGDLWGTELSLFTVLELVQNHRSDPRAAALLERAALYVVPSAHPDLRAARFGADGPGGPGDTGGEPRASVDGNFEIGWRPDLPGAGPYPLSEPEPHALARFLLEHENVTAVELLGAERARGTPAGLPELEPEDRAAHALLARRSDGGAGPLLVGLPELALPGATLLEFALGHRGAFGFLAPLVDAGGSCDELGPRALAATLALAESLPRLELELRSVERLSRELWQLDLSVANVGRLPSQSRLGARRFAAGPPRLEVSGAAKLVAAAVGTPEGGYEVAPTRGQGLRIAELEGGAAGRLRLVVRGAEGAALAVEARAPRAGVARLELGLP